MELDYVMLIRTVILVLFIRSFLHDAVCALYIPFNSRRLEVPSVLILFNPSHNTPFLLRVSYCSRLVLNGGTL